MTNIRGKCWSNDSFPLWALKSLQIVTAAMKLEDNYFLEGKLLQTCEVKLAQLCPTLCDHMDYTVHGILQASILEWVVCPFSRQSSQPRDQTLVSHIAGGFFTSWATREPQEYWSEWPIPSPADIPNPGIEPGSPAIAGRFFTDWAMREALICKIHFNFKSLNVKNAEHDQGSDCPEVQEDHPMNHLNTLQPSGHHSGGLYLWEPPGPN